MNICFCNSLSPNCRSTGLDTGIQGGLASQVGQATLLQNSLQLDRILAMALLPYFGPCEPMQLAKPHERPDRSYSLGLPATLY